MASTIKVELGEQEQAEEQSEQPVDPIFLDPKMKVLILPNEYNTKQLSILRTTNVVENPILIFY